ncbi:Peroxisomal membrane protein PEX13, partial [Stegodyphus mimosarum]
MAAKTPNFRGTLCCSDQLCRMSNMTNDGVRNLNALGNLSSINLTRRNQSVPLSSHYLNSSGSNNQFSSMPPPLPPRPDPIYSPRYGGLSGFGSYHSPFSRYSPGLYSGFGGYHQYPYSRYGAIDNSSNSFIQLAEESTRPAFESVESLVEVVSSISMMLESCYFAVHSSYSAILGVVDQFSRLKDRLAEVLSMLALLRALRWLCLKILYVLKLRKDNPSVDAAWRSATEAVSNSSPFTEDTNKSAWPFLFFIGLVVGAPWLMFKLLSKSITKKSFDPSTWVKDGKLAFAVTAYDFAATRPGELSFSAGEKLYLAPKGIRTSIPRGWLLACNRNK